MKKKTVIIVFLVLWMVLLNLATLSKSTMFNNPKFTCLVLSFVLFSLSYKLSEYLEDIGFVKKYQKINSVFVMMFLLLLFLPMSVIDREDKTLYENRYLVQWKPLITNELKINLNFAKDFDLWFNDRFFLRNNMIHAYNYIKLFIENKNNKIVIDPKTKFMYELSEFKIVDIAKIKRNFAGLYQLNEFCKNNNIKLYIVIAPKKSDIHNLNYEIVRNQKNSNEFLGFINDLQAKNILNIVYPYMELKQAAENDYMFFKTDHHWSEDAAFITYKELMKLIKKDFPNVKAVNNEDYNNFYSNEIKSGFERLFLPGATCFRMGIDYDYCRKYEDVKYRYYVNKDFKNLHFEETDIDYHRRKVFYYPKGYDLRVIMLGTSMSEQLTEFVPFTFKNVKRIRNNSVKKVTKDEEFKIMKYYQQEILDYKPDIMIFCISFGNLTRLNSMFNME